MYTQAGYERLRKFFRSAPVVFTMVCLLASGLALAWKTARDLRPFPNRLPPADHEVRKPQILDRTGLSLSVTYQNHWNIHDCLEMHQIPYLLQQGFIEAEDRRFFTHGGVDWLARLHAAVQNLAAFRSVRGASTITEQVARMLHPRPRTLWSRWIEGFEAARLESRFSKTDILEFYLNQVPYGHQRRGVLQAARLYFDRDLETLTPREALALVVLVRAPAAMDLRRNPKAVQQGISLLAARLHQKGILDDDQVRGILTDTWSLSDFRIPVEASHFAQHIFRNRIGQAHGQGPSPQWPSRLTTTLDGALQRKIQRILDARLADLHAGDVANGAVLVVDHLTDEVLAWVGGGQTSAGQPESWIDAITTPRQPGSTLKPFLYALALELGLTPATILDDSPLSRPIGSGLHSFHNYSRSHYGPVSLRDALGNSLNIPAIRTIQFTGVDRFLSRLHDLGFHSLTHPPDHYGEGLALGNGEVTLFELVQAYAVLARHGVFRPLRLTRETDIAPLREKAVFREENATLIADILSDPQARRMEFGSGSLLRMPAQTAVKTGTSSDHRDAWAAGFTQRHTVGVWMGNLDRRPTAGITGTIGPGLVLRSIFTELNRDVEPQPLPISSRLRPSLICRISGLLPGPHCPSTQEWFPPGSAPTQHCDRHMNLPPSSEAGLSTEPRRSLKEGAGALRLVQPTPGLQLARDPRIPDELEAFAFALPETVKTSKVEWIVDGRRAGATGAGRHRFLWPLAPGTHVVHAKVWQPGFPEAIETPPVSFTVK